MIQLFPGVGRFSNKITKTKSVQDQVTVVAAEIMLFINRWLMVPVLLPRDRFEHEQYIAEQAYCCDGYELCDGQCYFNGKQTLYSTLWYN